MSLNRDEDLLLRYLHDHPDEERFWRARVLEIDRAATELPARTASLERELRAYAAERSRAEASLQRAFGTGPVSVRNLAEHLFRVWAPPRAKARRSPPREEA